MPCTGMFADPLPILASIALGAAATYAVLHLMALAGLLRPRSMEGSTTVRLSVVVAARNESERIGLLLESLARQTRMPDEIVIVDDRSDDDTSGAALAFRERLPMLKVVGVSFLPPGMAPKKHALERGIEASSGEVLCLTDADVMLPPTWLASIEAHVTPGVGVVVGTYVPSSTSPSKGMLGSILRRFIEYEKYRSWLLSAGAIGWGFAWTASGSNLAYRRRVFEQVGGFSGQHGSLSGDDDLFVQRVRRETDWKIVAMPGPEATVTTEVPSTWGDLYRQRTRHLSAGRWYDGWSTSLLSLYHASNFVSTMALVAALVTSEHRFLTAYVVKVCADLLLCALGDLRVHRPRAWTWFLPLEFVHLFYLITIGPLAWMTKPSWKGTQAAR